MTNVTTNKSAKSKQIHWDISFVGWILFLIFRIPITKIVGNEGNGYYAISFEIYTLLSAFFGYSLHQTTKEMIKSGFKKYNHRTRASLFTLLVLFSIVISGLGAIALYFVSKYLLFILHYELSGITLRMFCFLLVIASVSGVFRGYFEGCGTKIPTAFSGIIEALVAGSGGIIFASILCKYGTKVGDLCRKKGQNRALEQSNS